MEYLGWFGEGGGKEREIERERDFHFLICSANSYHNEAVLRLKPRNLVLESHGGGKDASCGRMSFADGAAWASI